MHHPTDRIAHTTAFVTPVVEHWLEREIMSPGAVVRAMPNATVQPVANTIGQTDVNVSCQV